MTTKFPTLLRDSAILLVASAFCAFAYNELSSKRLPWVRVEKDRIMASDSLINSLASTPAGITAQATTSPTTAPTLPTQTPPTPANTPLAQDAVQKNKKDSLKAAQNLAAKAEAVKAETAKKEEPKASKSSTEAPSGQSNASGNASANAGAAAPTSERPKPLEIRIDQVEKLLANPDVLFIDARKANEFERGHIGNAINIFTPEFEQSIPRIIGLPREKPIVVYCGGGACELSHELAAHLVGLGFTRVFVYVGGWNEWEKKKG
ncbi:MAG: rhodanese-like domain-containing protein [Candidatus Kapaibacterium sp.]|nr:MAG: rhodanese-like domain-containing protein [Candidatus Kapabacteria bacterium]